jgi:hypothetical protein
LLYSIFCRFNQVIDWDALNATGSLTMAFFTVVAIYVAIRIPIKDRIIASKIDLFDKRYDVYFILCKIFKESYLQGQPSLYDYEYSETIGKTKYLIGPGDTFKVIELYTSIIQKIKDNHGNHKDLPEPLQPINRELDQLRTIFHKYLDLSNYGIEDID